MNNKLAKLGKYCFLGLFISMSVNIFAQDVPPKVKKLYDKGEYEKCIEVSKNIKGKGDNIKNPYLYLYQVMAYYQIALDEDTYNTRSPIDKALRAYTTFKRKDKQGTVSKEYEDFFSEFRDFVIERSQSMMGNSETAMQGLSLMMKIGEFFEEDDEMKYDKAKVMMDYGDSRTRSMGMNDMTSLADKLYAEYTNNKIAVVGMDKVFADLATFMFNNSDKVMAQEFLVKGKEMYPDSDVLKGASMYIVDQKINLNPEVSSLEQILTAKNSVEKSLKEYPNDKELLRKEDLILEILIAKYFRQGSTEGMTNVMMNHINKYADRRDELINGYKAYLVGIMNNYNYIGTADYKRTIALEALAILNKRLEGKNPVIETDQLNYVKGILNDQFAKSDLDSLMYYYKLADKWKPDNKVLTAYMTNLNYKGIPDKIMKQKNSLYNFAELISIADKTKGNKFYEYHEADYAYSYVKQLLIAKNYTDAAYIITIERRRNPNDKRFLELKKQYVIEDYKANFLGSELGRDDFKWTGNVENCDPGTLPPEMKAVIIQRLAYLRRLAGLRDDVFLDEEYNKKCQAAALIMDANNALTHHPPKTWKCYTEEGDAGAGSSNLSLGHGLGDALMGQMSDHGANNTACGHRRWILNPNNIMFGVGSTPSAMALGVFSGVITHNNIYDSIPPVWTYDDFVAWPTADYFIKSLVPRRWSFSYPDGKFENAEVLVKVDGKSQVVNIEHLYQGYGLNTIVWYIDDFKYKAGQVIEVTVSNFIAYDSESNSYIAKTISYKVELLPTPKGS